MRSSATMKESQKLSAVHNVSTDADSVVETLRKTLADEYMLLLKTQNAHWNVEGPNFFSLHQLFEEQYKEIFEFVDKVAETLRALKVKAPGSFAAYKDLASVQEFPEKVSYSQFISTLSEDHKNMSLAVKARLEVAEEAEETSCVVLYEDLVKFHDKAAWMIRAHQPGS